MQSTKNSQEVQQELSKLDRQIASAKKMQEILLEENKAIYSVYSWEAPDRVHDPKERSWYIAVATIAMVVIVYSALVFNGLLIITVIVLLLLLYAVNTVPPKILTHEITNKGMSLFNRLYKWSEIKAFWISKRGNHKLISLEIQLSRESSSHTLILLQGKSDLNKVVSYLVDHVDYLGENESVTNFLSRFLEGEYVPLINFLDEDFTKQMGTNEEKPEKKS